MQTLWGALRASGMFTKTAASSRGLCMGLSRPVVQAVLLHHSPARHCRLFSGVAQQQAWCVASPCNSTLLLQLARTQRSVVTTAAAAEEVQQQESLPPVNTGDLELDYHNFVVLTGNISSMVRDGQRFSCSLRVARTPAATEPGQVQQYDTFKVEAYDDVGAAASSSDLLQDDVLVMVQGSLYVVGMLPEVKVVAREFTVVNPCSPERLLSAQAYAPPPPEPAYAATPTQQAAGAAAATAAATQQWPAPAAGPIVAPGMPQTSSDPREQTWMDLFTNHNGWWDNRETKRGKQPDFKAKQGNPVAQSSINALWIEDSRTPQWVKDNLQQLPGNKPYVAPPGKATSSSWGASSSGVVQGFVPEPADYMSDTELAWIDVFNNYKNWWDNRVNKFNPKSPDFKHKTNGAALWLSNKDTPAWVNDGIATCLPAAPPPRQRGAME